MSDGQLRTGEQQEENPNEVDASPAKRFFVEMLTRDIELTDAILDLLDNCVDGAMRSKPKADSPSNKPYDGYFAEIRFSPTEFSIKDNCGGIDHAGTYDSQHLCVLDCQILHTYTGNSCSTVSAQQIG